VRNICGLGAFVVIAGSVTVDYLRN